MKYVSLKGLADFIASGPSKQRTIVRQFKYPKDDEARAKIVYYREARELVEAFHRAKHPSSWLAAEAVRLDALAASLSGRSRARLRHNARGIRQYAAHFGSRHLTPLPEVTASLSYGDVRISVVPDLHVMDGPREQVVKLEFSVDAPSPTEVKVISQLFFEATTRAGLGLPSAGVLFVDVPRGATHKGARAGARMLKTIEDACQTYSAIWDQL